MNNSFYIRLLTVTHRGTIFRNVFCNAVILTSSSSNPYTFNPKYPGSVLPLCADVTLESKHIVMYSAARILPFNTVDICVTIISRVCSIIVEFKDLTNSFGVPSTQSSFSVAEL